MTKLELYHAATKMIEADGVEAYQTCKQRFGQEIADVLIVAHLRRLYNPLGRWPEPDGLVEKVNESLYEHGILYKSNHNLKVRAVMTMINDCMNGSSPVELVAETIVNLLDEH